MKQINFSKLKGVNVISRSGQMIGDLKDFQIDAETMKISAIVVRPSGLVKNLLQADLYVNQEQILEISSDRIVIEDGAARENGKKVLVRELAGRISTEAEPLTSSDQI